MTPGQNMQDMMAMVDKDLGNIKLEESANDLQTVTVTASKPQFEMGIDRKVFNVEKSLTSTGQTAVEVMKNIPNLNVDIDGNVTISGSTPTKAQGTSQEYLLRRIQTEAPELIPDIGKGKKYTSARAAAIAAGIVKPKITIQFSPEESIASIASKIKPRVD